jgi:hypothetical protein
LIVAGPEALQDPAVMGPVAGQATPLGPRVGRVMLAVRCTRHAQAPEALQVLVDDQDLVLRGQVLAHDQDLVLRGPVERRVRVA